MNALEVFAVELFDKDISRMEIELYKDGSGSITSIDSQGCRGIKLVFEAGHSDGAVYDYSKIGTPNYVRYSYWDKGEAESQN